MPGKRGSKSFQERFSKIGQLAKDSSSDKLAELQLIYDENMIKVIDLQNKIRGQSVNIIELSETISLQDVTISKLNEENDAKNNEIISLQVNLYETGKSERKIINKICYREGRITGLSLKFNNRGVQNLIGNCRKRQLQKPSGLHGLSEGTKIRRAEDTTKVCSTIHGGGVSSEMGPVIDGMLHTLSLKCSAALLDPKILEMKPSITKVLHESVLTTECLDFYKSQANLLRSLNIYYCSNVLGKNKYIAVRRANEKRNTPNVVPYVKLAKKIRQIDIGELIPIEGTLDDALLDEERGNGYYRNL